MELTVMRGIIERKQQTEAVQVNADSLICNDKAAMATMAAMIAGYNMEQQLADHELQMLQEACRQFNVTTEEIKQAFWKAYADKFTGKRMYFRHLWTYIQAEREKTDISIRKRFTFGQVCSWLESRNLPLDYAPYFDFHKQPDGTKFYTLKPDVYESR